MDLFSLYIFIEIIVAATLGKNLDLLLPNWSIGQIFICHNRCNSRRILCIILVVRLFCMVIFHRDKNVIYIYNNFQFVISVLAKLEKYCDVKIFDSG